MNGVDAMDGPRLEVERALKTARIVCGAIVAAVVIYGGVAWWLARSGSVAPVDPGTANLLKQVFVAVMLIGVLGWMVIWGRARSPMPSTDARPEVERALKTARIVCGAVVAAVLIYGGVAWWLARSGSVAPVEPGTANLLKQVFVAVMLIGVLGWMVIWGRARSPMPSTDARPEVELREGPRGVVSKLISAYAFLEAVGLVGATVHLLTGSMGVLVAGVAIVVLGAALSYPREEWFQRFLQRRPV